MRTIVDLPEDRRRALDAYCARKKISRAEAVRRAVDELLRTEKDEDAIVARAFGAWKHLNLDTDAYLAELRAEWDRDPGAV